jgi:hypothetical protein
MKRMVAQESTAQKDEEIIISIVKEMTESMTGAQSTRHWAEDALWFDIPPFASRGIQPALKFLTGCSAISSLAKWTSSKRTSSRTAIWVSFAQFKGCPKFRACARPVADAVPYGVRLTLARDYLVAGEPGEIEALYTFLDLAQR